MNVQLNRPPNNAERTGAALGSLSAAPYYTNAPYDCNSNDVLTRIKSCFSSGLTSLSEPAIRSR